MRCMARNKVPFWFSRFIGKKPILNENGKRTGNYELLYTDPVQVFGNISAARGETQTQLFGGEEDYDRVIVMDNDAPVFDEYTVLWVDRIPKLCENGSLSVNETGNIQTPHDYIVKAVARSLNSVSYAIRKVNVSG